jgi:hypothetical protein
MDEGMSAWNRQTGTIGEIRNVQLTCFKSAAVDACTSNE